LKSIQLVCFYEIACMRECKNVKNVRGNQCIAKAAQFSCCA
jgi:hypothetical protein